MVFSGNANPELAKKVVDHLGIPLGDLTASQFSDGEINIVLNENVRGKNAFIFQSTCYPTNDNIIELLLISDALHRASAGRITAVIPYFGYARQDRRVRSSRVPISARVIADMISKAGIHRVLTVDLHADQIQGFFNLPVDNVYGSNVLLEDLVQNKPENLLIVSPDIGGVVRARAIAKYLDTDLAIVDKRRPKSNMSEVMNIIGDVEGRFCILVDDMVDTAGTLCEAANALKKHGAERVYAYATHPVLSGKAVQNITQSALDKLVVSDTIPLAHTTKVCEKIKQISLSKLMAESIKRIANEESISAMFD